MGNNIKVVMNPEGVKEVLANSASLIEEKATSIADRADSMTGQADGMINPNYVVKNNVEKISGTERPTSTVIAANPHSMRDNAKRNTLLKSMDAGK